jgi:type III secretion protein J
MRVTALHTLAGAFALALAGCAVPVAAGLDETDANRVVVALDRAGIDASKEADPTSENHFRVIVPRDDAARALATMADEQLPRPKAHGLLDAADRGQLVPSQAAEHAALIAGLGGELERTLSDVDGVLSARVHLNVPARDPLREGPPPKTTASVLIEHRGATPPIAAESVQRLVAGGAPGLAPADVTVVFVPHVSRAPVSKIELGHVGPIAVARGSMTALKGALAGLALLIIALAGLCLGLYARLSRLRRERDEQAAHGGGGAGGGARSMAPGRLTGAPGVAGGPQGGPGAMAAMGTRPGQGP